MRRDPTYVVVKEIFMENQFPYHEVRRPFILGTQAKQWKATLFHRFLEVLDQKKKLHRLFTQNIDGLDFQTSIDPDKIIAVHGSVGRAACEACGAPVDFDDFCGRVRANIKDIYGVDASAPEESTPMPCDKCGNNTLKPCTVLFGGSLPSIFFERLEPDLAQADLVLVAGTSLVVSPANMVWTRVARPRRASRVNRDGILGARRKGIVMASSTRVEGES